MQKDCLSLNALEMLEDAVCGPPRPTGFPNPSHNFATSNDDDVAPIIAQRQLKLRTAGLKNTYTVPAGVYFDAASVYGQRCRPEYALITDLQYGYRIE